MTGSIKQYLQKPYVILSLMALIFTVYFSFVAFSRHDNYYSRRLDLGNMDQTVWNVLHGNGFTLTDPMGSRQESRLAVHADFLLILLAPFYLIWSDPRMLILIQNVVTALAVFPIYWIAYDRLKSKNLALLFALLFLLYPPTERKMLHDFHAVSLSTTFMLCAYWFMQKKKYVYFIVFGILAALGKEQIWITFALMGVYIAFFQKKYVLGTLVGIAAFAVFYFFFWYAIPAVTPDNKHFALVYLSEFGENQNGIIQNILLHPLTVLRTVTLPDRLYYYFQLLFPVGFLSLFSPLYFLFAAPSLAINALSNNNLMRQIDYQYNSTVTPFTFIAAIEGYMVLCMIWEKLRKKRIIDFQPIIIAGWMVVCIVISSLLWGELPVGRTSRMRFFTTPLPEKNIMNEVTNSIGSGYSVSATNNIGAHFSQRRFLYNFPINAETADYSIIYLGDPYAWPSGDDQKKAVDKLLGNPEYVRIAAVGNFYAFKKKGI